MWRLQIWTGQGPPRPSEEPDDQAVFPHRLTIYCIGMCGNSDNIHFEGGERQPSLQPILQEREHDCDWASTGVLPAGRTPIDKQVPLQPASVSCRRGPGRSDSVYYCWR